MIYFIEAVGANSIKIGFTDKDDVEDWLAVLQTGCPFPLRVLKTMPGTVADEKDLHRRFGAARTVGEWFTATPELIAFIGNAELLDCGNHSVMEKSVAIRVLTVGRKQMSEQLLKQLPEVSPLVVPQSLSVLHTDQDSAVIRFHPSCDYWGWIASTKQARVVNQVHRCLIFVHKSALCKCWCTHAPLQERHLDHLRCQSGSQDVDRLIQVWLRFWNTWLAPDKQLFIGV